MYKLAKPMILFCLLLFASFSTTKAHNVFGTFTEIEWNDSDGSLEIVMQMHADILESKLSVLLGERLSFLNDAEFAKLNNSTGPLITQHLKIIANGTPVKLTYLGLEHSSHEVLLYLESELPSPPSSLEIEHNLFLDDLPGHINSILVSVKGQRFAGEISADSDPLEFVFE